MNSELKSMVVAQNREKERVQHLFRCRRVSISSLGKDFVEQNSFEKTKDPHFYIDISLKQSNSFPFDTHDSWTWAVRNAHFQFGFLNIFLKI